MVQHVNFYETIKEARMRLERTVVLYDNHPYYVLCIEDHKGDGIFRMYLDDMLNPAGMAHRVHSSVPWEWMDEPGYPPRAQKMDEWVDKNPDKGIIRKMMNSPSFNRFRPFPLGMINYKGQVLFTERQPTRSTYQGLTQQMVNAVAVSILPSTNPRGHRMDGASVFQKEFAEMLVADYPKPEECLKAMLDPRISNDGVAFHRQFALMRGPLDMLFLAYKGDVVGILVDHDFTTLRLGRQFKHLRESVSELNLFQNIVVKDI